MKEVIKREKNNEYWRSRRQGYREEIGDEEDKEKSQAKAFITN